MRWKARHSAASSGCIPPEVGVFSGGNTHGAEKHGRSDNKQTEKSATTLSQVPEQEEVPHVSKDMHARVHPGTAQPLAAHGEDASHGVADAARSVARQEQEHAPWPAEAGAW